MMKVCNVMEMARNGQRFSAGILIVDRLQFAWLQFLRWAIDQQLRRDLGKRLVRCEFNHPNLTCIAFVLS